MQQPIMTTTPVNQPMPTAAQEKKPKVEREEMWWIILAKSKTMRFFSVSCELILFIGCLWLTLTTILPSAGAWVNGGIDSFFLVGMGFAVDAAMPEAWLHVVDQWTDTPRKGSYLIWSVSVAIGMSLLVVANVTYSKVLGTSGKEPTGAVEVAVNVLLITRILIGISYVAIRECQSFLSRKSAKGQAQAEVQAQDFAVQISQLQADFQAKLSQLQAATQSFTTLASEHSTALATLKQAQQNTQTALPEMDVQAVIQATFQAVTDDLVPQFQARFQAVEEEISGRFQAVDQALFRQNVTISEVAVQAKNQADIQATIQAKRLPEKATATRLIQAELSGKKATRTTAEMPALHLVTTNDRDALRAEARRLHDEQGLSSYAIAEQLGKSPKTVQSWLVSGKNSGNDSGSFQADETDFQAEVQASS